MKHIEGGAKHVIISAPARTATAQVQQVPSAPQSPPTPALSGTSSPSAWPVSTSSPQDIVIVKDFSLLYMSNGVRVELKVLELRVVGPAQIHANAETVWTGGSMSISLGWSTSGPE